MPFGLFGKKAEIEVNTDKMSYALGEEVRITARVHAVKDMEINGGTLRLGAARGSRGARAAQRERGADPFGRASRRPQRPERDQCRGGACVLALRAGHSTAGKGGVGHAS